MTNNSDAHEKLLRHLNAAIEVQMDPAAPNIKAPGHALVAVQQYLREIGIPEASLAPLFRLSIAIDDHLRGKPNPMLIEVPTPGNRPPENIDSEVIKGIASAAMTLLMDAGEKKEQAARIVTRSIASWGDEVAALLYSPHRKTESWRKIFSWRDRIKRQDRNNDYGASVYYKAIDKVRKAKVDPRKGAAFLLDNPPPIFSRSTKQID